MDLYYFIDLFSPLFPLLAFPFTLSFIRHFILFCSSLLNEDEEEENEEEEEEEINLKYNNITSNIDYSSNYNDLSLNNDSPIIYYRK